MKENEAPEKIHVSIVPNSLNSYTYITCGKDFPNAVEYIRTDAFIEKAAEWLRKNADNYTWYDETEGESCMIDGFTEVFINYMKGE